MKAKGIAAGVCTLLAAGIFAGCSGGKSESAVKDAGAEPSQKPASSEPVTLKFYTMQNDNYSKDKEENFENEIGRFIKAKFPNITIEHVHKPKVEDFVTTGEFPDITLDSSSYVKTRYMEYGMQYDLADEIKKNNYDLSKLNPVLIEQLKAYAGDGKLYALPFTGSNFIMFYNKDIFDKFGVPYPKDGMTWDETYDLAKKIARTDGGNPYYGFMAHPGLMMKYNQLSLDSLSPKEDKALVQTDGWKRLFDNLKRFYEIPDNPYTSVDDFPKGQIAMDLHVSEKLTLWPQMNQNMGWDVVSAPTFPEKPKIGLQPNEYSLYVTSQSKHKDEAFQVIAYLTSEEVQTYLSKKGYVTPLVSKDVQKVVGQDIPGLQGKNVMNAIYYNNYANPPASRDPQLTYVDGMSKAGTYFTDMLKNGEDTNTTLRKWEEDLNQQIAAAKAAKGK
jgi:multiple sugar transport system substrate-binding protein